MDVDYYSTDKHFSYYEGESRLTCYGALPFPFWNICLWYFYWIVFFLLIYKISLFNWDINALSVICLANFFRCVACFAYPLVLWWWTEVFSLYFSPAFSLVLLKNVLEGQWRLSFGLYHNSLSPSAQSYFLHFSFKMLISAALTSHWHANYASQENTTRCNRKTWKVRWW